MEFYCVQQRTGKDRGIKMEPVVDIYASGYTRVRIESRYESAYVCVKDGDPRPIAGQPFLHP